MDLLEGKMIHQSPKPGPKTSRTRPRTPSHRWHAGHGRGGRGCACFRSLKAPSWQWKTGARFKDRIFPTLFGTPQRSPNHLKLMHRGEPNLPGIRIQFVISDMLFDMRSGINLFDLSSCFGNTLHCITSEKSVKAFAGLQVNIGACLSFSWTCTLYTCIQLQGADVGEQRTVNQSWQFC